MLAFLSMGYRYLFKSGYATQRQAVIIIALTAINWRTMLLATTLMSDAAYAAISIGVLYLAEKFDERESSLTAGIMLGVAMGLAFLTRSSGVALLIAFGVYCVAQHRWRRALVPLSVASLFVLGWIGWAYLDQSSEAGINGVYHLNYVRGLNSALGDLAIINNTSLAVTLLSVIGTNILLLIVGSVPLACLGLRYDLPPAFLVSLVLATLVFVAAGAFRHLRGGLRLLHLYIPVYLALHLAVPGSAYDRYLLPLVPFVLLFLVRELSVPVQLVRREMITGKPLRRLAAVFVCLSLLGFAGGACFSNISGIYASLLPDEKGAASAKENAAAIEWIKENAAPSDVVASYRDPICYLNTGRKAVLSFPLAMLNTIPYQSHDLSFDAQAVAFLKLLSENNARYLLLNSGDFKYESELYRSVVLTVIEQRPKQFIPVFSSWNGGSIIYRIDSGLD